MSDEHRAMISEEFEAALKAKQELLTPEELRYEERVRDDGALTNSEQEAMIETMEKRAAHIAKNIAIKSTDQIEWEINNVLFDMLILVKTFFEEHD